MTTTFRSGYWSDWWSPFTVVLHPEPPYDHGPYLPGCHLVASLRDVDEVNGVAEAAAARKGAVEVDVPVVERVGPSNLRATSHIPPEKIDFPAGAAVR